MKETIIIKRYILLLLLTLLIVMTACDSKKNIETAIANENTTIESSTKESEVTATIESSTKESEATATIESSTKESEVTATIESSTKESEATAAIESSTKESEATATIESSTKESEATTAIESSTKESKATIQNTTEPQLIEIEPITEPVESDSTSEFQNKNSKKLVSSDKDNKKISWSFKRNADHSKVIGYNAGVDITKYNSYYIGDTSKKIIYLTFDEGYEYGYTPSILDTLKANNVKATFFLTKPFIKSESELSKRIAEDGHVVGNHSVTHPSMPDKTDEEISYEVEETARYYKEITGHEMDKFFRPPAGEFSERTLDITNQLGYKTIFWSLAYGDWDVNKQPGKEAAYKHVMDNYHNGGIFLLHAVSQSNAEALDNMLKGLKANGYTFASLYDLP